MNHFTILSLLLIVISCANTTNNHQYNTTNDLVIEEPQTIKEPYNIRFEIDKIDAKDEYNLIVSMELNNGSYFGSPFSNNNFSGLFNISIENNDNLIIKDTLIETPRSVETMDFRENVPVNWVSVNTTYQQHFKIIRKDNFKVNGLVRFVIEPNCTLEKIKFVIVYEAGKIKITSLSE